MKSLHVFIYDAESPNTPTVAEFTVAGGTLTQKPVSYTHLYKSMGKTLPENSSRNFITVLRAARTSKSRYLQNTRDCKYTTANSEDHRCYHRQHG